MMQQRLFPLSCSKKQDCIIENHKHSEDIVARNYIKVYDSHALRAALEMC